VPVGSDTRGCGTEVEQRKVEDIDIVRKQRIEDEYVERISYTVYTTISSISIFHIRWGVSIQAEQFMPRAKKRITKLSKIVSTAYSSPSQVRTHQRQGTAISSLTSRSTDTLKVSDGGWCGDAMAIQ